MNTKTLLNLCLHFAKHDGQDRKKQKENRATKVTKISKTKRYKMNKTLEMKPNMPLLELTIFSQYNVITRPTKIINILFKDPKILTFQVIFQHKISL